MAPIDLNLLRLFSIVAETSSFSDAARKLDLPRSSVSRGVAALEAALGVQLFNRTTRKVALSTAGAAFHERIAPQLSGLQQALGSMPERDELPSGELRLSATPDFGINVLPEILAGFGARYPAITLDLRLEWRMVDLVAEGFDVALRIRSGRLDDSSLVARRLSALDIGLYAAPSYLARRGAIRTPEEAGDHDWILFRGEPPPPPIPKPSRRPRLRCDDLMFVHEAVRAGMGIAVLPGFLARTDLAAGALVRLLPRFSIRTGTLYFVHPAVRKVSRKVIALRDYLVEQIAAHPLCPGT